MQFQTQSHISTNPNPEVYRIESIEDRRGALDFLGVGDMLRKKSFHVNLETTTVPADDLYLCLKPLLRFGQLIGICPFGNLWSKHPDIFPTFQWKSPLVLVNLAVIFVMSVNLIMNFAGMIRKVMTGESNPIQIAWALMYPMFYSVATLTYINFCLKGDKFCSILLRWRSCARQLVYAKEDTTVMWKIRFWTMLLLTSATLENVVYHFRVDCSQSNCIEIKNGTKLDELETYYWRDHGENWALVPFNPVVTIFLFAVNKLTVLATNFSDVLIISMAWVIGSKLKGFVEITSAKVKDKSICWIQTRKDFVTLYRMIQDINSFLSPIIFNSYALLLELISTQIHLGITTDSERPVVDKVYAVWSFLHLVARLLCVSLVASKITERCQEIVVIVQKCPPEKFTNEVERLERLVSSPIGLSGLGCFRITKPFMLSVVHVIFTCEIIFLQTAPAKPPNCVESKNILQSL